MTTTEFLRPRLTGRRFEKHQVPLEFLNDLAVFQDMVVEVAKSTFLSRNPDRKRSPRGFASGVSLQLSRIEDGSAVPVIVLVMAEIMGQQVAFSEQQLAMEESRDAIIQTIGAAEKADSSGIKLSPKALSYFHWFGKSLRDDEAMEFDVGNGQPVKLTKESRKLLLQSAAEVAVIDDISSIVSVPEADHERDQFTIQTSPEGVRIIVKGLKKFGNDVLEAFNGYSSGRKVRIQGRGQVDINGNLMRIESVEDVSLIHPLDVAMRIEKLKELRDGWYEGDGTALPVDGLDWFVNAFDQYIGDAVALPHIYPTLQGGIRAEWTLASNDISLEVNLESKKADWHSLDLGDDAEESKTLNLAVEADWKWIVDTLLHLSNAK